MTRKSWLKPPHSDTSRPGTVKATTLADVAKPDKAPREHSCRHCLTPEAQEECQGRMVSNLKNGVCRDRAACEERQPPLIGLDEFMSPYIEPDPVRQWCEYCQAATRTWTDSSGVARCARHEPENDDGPDDDWDEE